MLEKGNKEKQMSKEFKQMERYKRIKNIRRNRGKFRPMFTNRQ